VTQPAASSKQHSKHHPKHKIGHKKVRIKKQNPTPVEPKVQQLIDMGFPRPHVEYALKELREEDDPRPELVVAWLLDHPGLEVLSVFLDISIITWGRQSRIRSSKCRDVFGKYVEVNLSYKYWWLFRRLSGVVAVSNDPALLTL
jgi:uncharacterized UBP type Zn finger protein